MDIENVKVKAKRYGINITPKSRALLKSGEICPPEFKTQHIRSRIHKCNIFLKGNQMMCIDYR